MCLVLTIITWVVNVSEGDSEGSNSTIIHVNMVMREEELEIAIKVSIN